MIPENDNEWVYFKNSAIHGMGGFARKTIPPETEIIEYVGEKIDKQEALRRCEQNNPFIFTLDDHWDLDGDVPWNPARFINHSCSPNCEAQLMEGEIWIVALREIAPDEELTFNYGYGLEEFEEHPCQCGSPNCLGYIVSEEFFETVRSTLARQRDSLALPLPQVSSG